MSSPTLSSSHYLLDDMSAPTLNYIPSTIEDWKTEAEKFGVENSSANRQPNVASASKFADNYAALGHLATMLEGWTSGQALGDFRLSWLFGKSKRLSKHRQRHRVDELSFKGSHESFHLPRQWRLRCCQVSCPAQTTGPDEWQQELWASVWLYSPKYSAKTQRKKRDYRLLGI